MHSNLNLEQRIARLHGRAAEIALWAIREDRDLHGWMFDGNPIELGSAWPRTNGVITLELARFETPDEWDLSRTELDLSLGGEALAEVCFASGARTRLGLDPYHSRIPLADRRGSISVQAVARLPFGQPAPAPKVDRARLVLREPVVEELAQTLMLIAETGKALGDHEVVSHLLAVGEAATARLLWPTADEDVMGRLLQVDTFQTVWSLPSRPFAMTPLPPEVISSAEKNLAGLKEGLNQLRTIYPPIGSVAASGHAHIDLAWLWPLDETRRKVKRSFANAISLIAANPGFRFVQSFADYYAELEASEPELFEEIKAHVADGTIEPTGAMWVEPDVVMPSGEALTRQLLYGQRYFEQRFGKRHRLAWLPDTFGFGATLPQLLKQAGIDSLFTTKLSWSETNHFPHQSLDWEGLDGSRVYLHMINDRRLGYNGRIVPEQILGIWWQHQPKVGCPEAYMTIGYGDGGGGPVPQDIANRNILARFPVLPQVRFSTAQGYFDEAEPKTRSDRPLWVGELYLEYHRGCLTSQGRLKRLNRQLERDLVGAEVLGSLCWIAGGAMPESMEETWRMLMRNQFHDILPGSSIAEVYVRAERELEEALKVVSAATGDALARVGQQMNGTAGATGLLVVNPDLRERPLRLEANVEVPGAQRIADGWVVGSDATVPPLAAVTVSVDAPASPVEAGNRWLENRFVRAEFDEAGALISLWDKRANREAIAGAGAQLWAFTDKPRGMGGVLGFDAWDIEEDIFENGRPIAAQSIEITEQGPHRAALRITRIFGGSRITQNVRLWANSARLDFYTHIDWHERRTMLKLRAPLDIRAHEAVFECAHGVVRRPTHQNTSWDRARFEVPGHRFADLSEPDFGCAILNDGRYGYHAIGSELGLTLLRSAIYPDPLADEGEHRITYSLFSHQGSWSESDLLMEAEDLNRPLYHAITAAPPGTVFQPIKIAQKAALSALKPSEDGNDLVLRLYEPTGSRCHPAIEVPAQWEIAGITNLLEEDVADPGVMLRPFELRSYRLTKRRGGKFEYLSPIPEENCASILLGCCTTDWTDGACVVGNAFCKAKLLGTEIGDLVLEERLRDLGRQGRIEIDDRRAPYGKYRVRLPQA
jgi:alpha-mannosidase